MASTTNVLDVIQDWQRDKSHVLHEMYLIIFIRGTCPWSEWWHLSAETSFTVDENSTRSSADGSPVSSASRLRIIDGPTDEVRMHPLLGTHGGLFDSGSSHTIQVPDPFGAPYRWMPADYDMIGMCLATKPDGYHFITLGAVNVRDAVGCIDALRPANQLQTGRSDSSFRLMLMDSLSGDNNLDNVDISNSLLHTLGLVSSCCAAMAGRCVRSAHFLDGAVTMRNVRSKYIIQVETPQQVNGNTCAFHAACNLQRIIAICRAHTDNISLGMQVPWFPDVESWIHKCMVMQLGTVGAYPIEAVCTMLHLRVVILARLANIPGGLETDLYECLDNSIKRMTKDLQAGLAQNKLVNVRSRMKLLKTSMSTSFSSERERQFNQSNEYML